MTSLPETVLTRQCSARVFLASLVAVAALLLFSSGAAWAQDDDGVRRVDFSVSRDASVDNDRATAVLRFTDEDEDAADLADRVNEAMRWALDRARKERELRSRTGTYRTHPVTQEGKIRRWRAMQDLVVEGEDLKILTSLVGDLQSRLQLASIHFAVSPEKRRAQEDLLIDEALEAYARRAARIRDGLGAEAYELVHLSVETDSTAPPPRPFQAEMARTLSVSDVAQPAFEAGTSRVAVRLHATIELRDGDLPGSAE
ncbi:MAG: SIMPL domain-containing protein [Myxococcota bacterium]|nr:SIMPL domain-containing protein [Myxococcota bacterium]